MNNLVVLDASMPARAVLARCARQGFWLDPKQPQAAEWISEMSKSARSTMTDEELIRRLKRDPSQAMAAIRRQWFANVLWYSYPLIDVLTRCAVVDPAQPLIDVLNLHEHDSRPTVPLVAAANAPSDSVVLDGDQPMGVGPTAAQGNEAAPASGRARGFGTGGGGAASRAPRSGPQAAAPAAAQPAAPAAPPRVWPRLDARDYVPAGTPFDVVVGFAAEAQRGVTGGAMVLEAPAGVSRIGLTVVISASGVDAPDGWSKPLDVEIANPTAAEARFSLIGRPPTGTEPVHLTSIEARYIRDGAIIGSASRPIVIGLPTMATLNTPEGRGAPWLTQLPSGTAVDLQPAAIADLTIELAKPDRNAATGIYSCWLHTRHPLSVAKGPHDIDLGQDAKTFARSVVDQLRTFGGHEIVSNLLESFGDLVGEQLPGAVMTAIGEIAARVAPGIPSVLIVSADPYVPWELARMKTPIDPSRPAYLGAQVLLGRWLQDGQASAPANTRSKPPAQPPSTLPVKHMAVMAGKYKLDSGLRALPAAEAEAQTIVTEYKAVPLAASLSALKRLLDADLEQDFDRIGGVDAVHFAGHGEFDPSKPDSSVLFLSDGLPLSSILFRSAKYGDDHQPLLFLNACMIGIGGQLLGDMGGFPGNCLKGGFGGLLGALWEVDDSVAGEIAVEFWKRAMAGEQVGAILRDLRGKFVTGGGAVPVSTYLAYVYYGHPCLTLQRAV